LHLAPKEAEHRFLSAGYENCMALYGSQGLDFDHLSTSQMQEMLYQYHRSEVPFIVDVCPRISGRGVNSDVHDSPSEATPLTVPQPRGDSNRQHS
jgi:hypothetical protein